MELLDQVISYFPSIVLAAAELQYRQGDFENNPEEFMTHINLAIRYDRGELLRKLVLFALEKGLLEEIHYKIISKTVEKGYLNVTRMIIESKNDPVKRLRYVNDALITAACTGDLDVIKEMIEIYGGNCFGDATYFASINHRPDACRLISHYYHRTNKSS